ncbi:hypothetical protein HDV05_008624 [Chytridiales sp. JEL 0842]|nr:hypothetical protein HDV05_008624 [Chytridiales sp. JEL 0842]
MENPFDDDVGSTVATSGRPADTNNSQWPTPTPYSYQQPLQSEPAENPFGSNPNLLASSNNYDTSNSSLPLADEAPYTDKPRSSKPVRRMSTIACPYSHPSEMPPEALAILSQTLSNQSIDVPDLFARLERTRLNAEAWMRGERGKVEHDPSRADLSKADMGYESLLEATPKKKTLGDKVQKFFEKVKSQGNPLAPGGEPGKSTSYAGLSKSYGMPGGGVETPSSLPPPPPHIQEDDMLQLAIYYHEKNDLKLSAYFLRKSADQRHPLGLFLYSMALRHGWGVDENQDLAFRSLLLAAEMSLMTIPNVAQRSLNRNAKRAPTNPRSTSSAASFSQYANIAESLPEDLGVALSLLPLPLYEIAVCFQQGWGVGRSLPAAAYYFDMAAKLGDPDAMYELGYCYLNGSGVPKDKGRAANWLRQADALGKRVIGESWIHKEKWGGHEK